jgi:hypothetical protein
VVSLSTTKAKYKGAVNASTEAVSIHNLISELGFSVEKLNVVYYDNQSAIQVVENPVAHSKMKHVELCAHYLRQFVHDVLVYCKKDDQITNIFTKPLQKLSL